jgi:hypothetical protein
MPSGYVQVFAPGHPRASLGFVLEHVLVVERVLGRSLPPDAVIHHVDQDRGNNLPSNLAVLENHAEHRALHVRLTVLRAGGDPWTQRVCCSCKHPKAFDEFYQATDRARTSECKECSRARARVYQQTKRSAA